MIYEDYKPEKAQNKSITERIINDNIYNKLGSVVIKIAENADPSDVEDIKNNKTISPKG